MLPWHQWTGLPVVTVCLKDNLSSAAFLTLLNISSRSQNGQVFSVVVQLWARVWIILIDVCLITSSANFSRFGWGLAGSSPSYCFLLLSEQFLLLSSCAASLMVREICSARALSAHVCFCVREETGRKDGSKDVWFCLFFWGRLSEKRALMGTDRPLSVTQISGYCSSHVWFWWNLTEQSWIYPRKNCKRVREILLLVSGQETPVSDHQTSLFIFHNSIVLLCFSKQGNNPCSALSNSISTLPAEGWCSRCAAPEDLCICSERRHRKLRGPPLQGLQRRR